MPHHERSSAIASRVESHRPVEVSQELPRKIKRKDRLTEHRGVGRSSGRWRKTDFSRDKDYSRLAMRAAKRMKSSKDKARTSQLVCFHLKALLESQAQRPSQPAGEICTQARSALALEGGQVPLPI